MLGFIPLRKGSKSIIAKNKKKLLGRPLFSWTLAEAILSNLDRVIVYTDDEDIIEFVNNEYASTNKVQAILRPESTATDTASTEAAMFQYLEDFSPEIESFTLIQATSPLLEAKHINESLDKIFYQGFDSALSVVPFKRFFWKHDGTPENYDFLNRPRRQDFQGTLIENGAVYSCKIETLLAQKNRLGGKIGLVEMPEESLVEIDEPADWIVVEKLLENRLRSNRLANSAIKAMIFDVDGVFTDASVVYTKDGEFGKSFSFVDGMGLELLRSAGVEPIIMTSENSALVKSRMDKLKIKQVHLGVKDKFLRAKLVLKDLGISFNEVAYMGDDINDKACLLNSNWALVPNNALPEVKQVADVILNNSGGFGALREAVTFAINFNNRKF